MYLCCIIIEGKLGKNFLRKKIFYKVTLLYVLNAFTGTKIPLGVVKDEGLGYL
jgi:hypothetical protein